MSASEPTIRYQDDQLAVISKQAGLVVHPGAGNRAGTMTDWLVKQWPKLAEAERAGLLHRLDKDTSGLLVIAKTPEAKRALGKQFVDRSVSKTYQALVRGIPAQPRGKIEAPITRHHADRKRMTVRPDGKTAETTYAIQKTYAGNALLEVTISTGRTHQIRVHLAALGHPVIGDATYGEAEPELGRQFLHASQLSFTHPSTGQPVTVRDPLPEELANYLRKRS